ncbi:hypothetical protein ACFQS3_19535 [Glycomyces mayteni]|uniref:DUF3558 domain-containing protein n=1 Tax=Glycomyces mayteni TaxID=543887 RepID=A0ABW2DDU9_9ACTN|nr:hypothetical protein GCM10025732_04000 [Glycomyces mayteni]
MRRKALAVGVVVVLAVVIGLIPWLMRLNLDYRFALPDTWTESCLGSEAVAADLIEWEAAPEAQPEVRTGGSSHRYQCEWRWRSESGGGQLLALTIDVDDDRAYGEHDPSIESSLGLGSEDWSADSDSLDGWEYGLCRQVDTGLGTTLYECIASSSNLRLTLESRDLPGGNGFEDKLFGPGAVSVEELTVELGELVRETFKR